MPGSVPKHPRREREPLMGAPIDLDLASLAEPVSGIVLMLIAGFAPYLVYKLVAFVGFDLYTATATEQEAKQTTTAGSG